MYAQKNIYSTCIECELIHSYVYKLSFKPTSVSHTQRHHTKDRRFPFRAVSVHIRIFAHEETHLLQAYKCQPHQATPHEGHKIAFQGSQTYIYVFLLMKRHTAVDWNPFYDIVYLQHQMTMETLFVNALWQIKGTFLARIIYFFLPK